MLLRSLTKHVKDQNWFAVFLDFFIVVAGILIAFQITNWNEAQTNKHATISALERLNSEIAANMDAAGSVISRIEEGADIRAAGIAVLESCDPSEAAHTSVIDAITSTTGDILPAFLNNITQELARQDRYTQFLSDDFLTALNIYDGHISDEAEQLAINFGLMWNDHVSKNPKVSITSQSERIFGRFMLVEPLEIVCKDNVFSRQLIMTNVWHEGFKMRLNRFKDRSQTFRAALEAEQMALK